MIYQVLVSRTVSEFTTIQVEAPNWATACVAAERLAKYEEEWELEDNEPREYTACSDFNSDCVVDPATLEPGEVIAKSESWEEEPGDDEEDEE